MLQKILIGRQITISGVLEDGTVISKRFNLGDIIILGETSRDDFCFKGQQRVQILKTTGQYRLGQIVVISGHQAANWIERGVAKPIE